MRAILHYPVQVASSKTTTSNCWSVAVRDCPSRRRSVDVAGCWVGEEVVAGVGGGGRRGGGASWGGAEGRPPGAPNSLTLACSPATRRGQSRRDNS